MYCISNTDFHPHTPTRTREILDPGFSHTPTRTREILGPEVSHTPTRTREILGPGVSHTPTRTREILGPGVSHTPTRTREILGPGVSHTPSLQVDSDPLTLCPRMPIPLPLSISTVKSCIYCRHVYCAYTSQMRPKDRPHRSLRLQSSDNTYYIR